MLRNDYLEVLDGRVYEYHDGGKSPTLLVPGTERYMRAERALSNDAYMRLHAEGLGGRKLVALNVPLSRTESPQYAISAATNLLELERRGDFGGLHHQAVRDFQEGCPSTWEESVLRYYLPDGSLTDWRTAIVAWARCQPITTLNRAGERIEWYCW